MFVPPAGFEPAVYFAFWLCGGGQNKLFQSYYFPSYQYMRHIQVNGGKPIN